ncbi:MAG: hypothetical protein E7620_00155 [Ruminococcaceae bacterium]|nr:hypothetical protein [Oscillospiraceae bacterium]
MSRKNVRAICFAVAATLLALALTACGSSGKGGDETSSTVAALPSGTAAETPNQPPAQLTKQVRISEDELYDKLVGGWIGQMLGVGWAASTEFKWCGSIIPEDSFPKWEPSMINDAFRQDDLYVEVPFLDAMKNHGALCDSKHMADAFRDSKFPLWHANVQARENLLEGIEYPNSGSYLYNYHCDDLDWQIECDFLGQMYPGLVNASAMRSFDVGHITNYGDGVYGGVFITAMHAAAYTAESIQEIINAGIAVIPENTEFRMLIDQVMENYRNGCTWKQNWNKIEARWGRDDRCCDLVSSKANIDAKLNSAYVLIGLLYGEGDLEQTVIISGRCGQDSDCNPSSAASILGNFYGASKIPEDYTDDLRTEGITFHSTTYTFSDVVDVSFQLMKEILAANGAVCEDGVWTIPVDLVYAPVPFEQWPEDYIGATMSIATDATRAIRLKVSHFGTQSIASVELDMGDGTVLTALPTEAYEYKQAGEYTITCKLTGSGGSTVTIVKKAVIEDRIIVPGRAICSITNPQGGGNKDMQVMYDHIVPAVGTLNASLQYDTYRSSERPESVYAGVEFDVPAKLTGVAFTEGMHFNDGGWFENAPTVEVLVDGVWKAVEASVSPIYPLGTYGRGSNFDTYTFTFAEEVVCEGVRLIGKPGGSACFISIGEITPFAVEIYPS